jgi:hypothetical protein
MFIPQQERYRWASGIDVMPAHLCKFVLSGRTSLKASSWATKCAHDPWGWSSCPRCGDLFDNSIHAHIHCLQGCFREVLSGVDNDWATLVDIVAADVEVEKQCTSVSALSTLTTPFHIAACQGLNLLTAQSGGMEFRRSRALLSRHAHSSPKDY